MYSKGHPTVDRQAGARHVAGLSARQVGDETGNLVGIAGALQRDRRRYAVDVVRRHVGERRPWLEVFDSDAARSEVDRDSFDLDGPRSLGHCVVAKPWKAAPNQS